MSGKLDIYIGCMFSGKSTELQRHARRLDVINAPYTIINHSFDKRYGENVQSTHNKETLNCVSLNNLYDVYNQSELCEKYRNSEYVFIEEAQFFDDLFDFVVKSVNEDGKNVLIYGLDGDFMQKPFGDILRLIPYADNVHKLKSFCKMCNNGEEGLFTIRINNESTDQVLVGNQNIYTTVCRKHLLQNKNNDLNKDLNKDLNEDLNENENMYVSAGAMSLK